ncbi:MAG: 5-formyltetrahydrofolate cyclo-ligase [Candidatus Omnitrophica bacterium]|nr:5-formyltetrahydrofolate cyclo-ligase [Candidatus Omnitrophota bacterium]
MAVQFRPGAGLDLTLMTIVQDKEKFRQAVLAQLKCQSQDLRRRRSDLILEKLKRRSEFRKSLVTMFYVSTSDEVDTKSLLLEMLREGKEVVVPYIDRKIDSLIAVQIQNAEEDLRPGTYGILEPRHDLVRPFDLNRLDLVLVPGIAFDRRGHRLGRGKGYYDRFLKMLPSHVKCFGLAFDFQVFKSVPTEDWDISVDRVITNR